MKDKIIPFPLRGERKVLVNAMMLALDNEFEVVLTIKDKRGQTYHVSNIHEDEAKSILKVSLYSR